MKRRAIDMRWSDRICLALIAVAFAGCLLISAIRLREWARPQPVAPAETTRVYDTTRVVRVLSYRFVNGVLKDSTTIMLPDSLSVRGTQRRNAGRP
jgi:hypothetical protein